MDFTYFYEAQAGLLKNLKIDFTRYLYNEINFTNKAIMILGQRGTGKTTLMLQHIKNNFNFSKKALYISVDNPFFKENDLYKFAKNFEQNGGEILYIDEIHKQKDWSYHIKSIIDTTSLRLVISGSSMLDLHTKSADLSRRIIPYFLHNLSFREYLILKGVANIEKIKLEKIFTNSYEESAKIANTIKPLEHFKDYLKNGAYPFFFENQISYHQKLINIINQIIESDMPYICKINFSQIDKIKKLIYILSTSVPFSPNISELARVCELSRPTLMEYLSYLENAGLINILNFDARGYSKLSKPDKIFLNNTNLSYAISKEANIGSNRESFFINQVKNLFTSQINLIDDKLLLSKNGDFLIDKKYTIEIGGKNKTKKQIKQIENSFVVKDDIDTASNRIIPLWLFGFLY